MRAVRAPSRRVSAWTGLPSTSMSSSSSAGSSRRTSWLAAPRIDVTTHELRERIEPSSISSEISPWVESRVGSLTAGSAGSRQLRSSRARGLSLAESLTPGRSGVGAASTGSFGPALASSTAPETVRSSLVEEAGGIANSRRLPSSVESTGASSPTRTTCSPFAFSSTCQLRPSTMRVGRSPEASRTSESVKPSRWMGTQLGPSVVIATRNSTTSRAQSPEMLPETPSDSTTAEGLALATPAASLDWRSLR